MSKHKIDRGGISMKGCICGCGRKRGLQLHHVIYRQELRRHVPRAPDGLPNIVSEIALLGDRRNLIPVGPKCHAAHHNRQRPFHLRWLPSETFEFAAETLGADRAYEYLRRRYAGDDPRLDALLTRTESEAA